jgi:dimethylhistidine N-methyltransferase
MHAANKELPCKYFYDEAGSKLFEEITELDEYYLTRTELGIMRQEAASMAALVGPECLLVEYGSGNGTKIRLLLDQLADPVAYVPVEISEASLQQSVRKLARLYPSLEILPVRADFTQPFALPQTKKRPRRRVVYFPGSTIGNCTSQEAIALLRRTVQLCGPGGGMLLGADRKKDPAIIEAAYNDASGVTAAFNFNLLTRINRELGGDFQLDGFWHHAFYNSREGRIEMHLVSRHDRPFPIAGKQFDIAEGESIRTEYSYKYSPSDLEAIATAAGFAVEHTWSDAKNYFSVVYLTAR